MSMAAGANYIVRTPGQPGPKIATGQCLLALLVQKYKYKSTNTDAEVWQTIMHAFAAAGIR